MFPDVLINRQNIKSLVKNVLDGRQGKNAGAPPDWR